MHSLIILEMSERYIHKKLDVQRNRSILTFLAVCPYGLSGHRVFVSWCYQQTKKMLKFVVCWCYLDPWRRAGTSWYPACHPHEETVQKRDRLFIMNQAVRKNAAHPQATETKDIGNCTKCIYKKLVKSGGGSNPDRDRCKKP